MAEFKMSIPPSIPTMCRDIFARKLAVLSLEEVKTLTDQTQAYMRTIRKEAVKNKNINVPLLERMTKAMCTILKEYAYLPEEHRALVVGAARYFIDTDDASNDLEDPLGFDDDLAVMNTVFVLIGRNDLVVTR